MGGSQSVEVPGGGTEGYHVLRVQVNDQLKLACRIFGFKGVIFNAPKIANNMHTVAAINKIFFCYEKKM